MKRIAKILGAISILLAMTLSCEKDRTTGSMTIRMKDAPVAFDEVNVEITLIQVHYGDDNNSSNESGWINLETESGIYNLLDLQNGVTTALVVDEELPVGHVTQMRLILGDDNSVLVDGIISPLELSSQDKTGLKINLNTTIQSNDNVEILFDFDAEKSIVIKGNGSFQLKPVLYLESVIFL